MHNRDRRIRFAEAQVRRMLSRAYTALERGVHRSSTIGFKEELAVGETRRVCVTQNDLDSFTVSRVWFSALRIDPPAVVCADVVPRQEVVEVERYYVERGGEFAIRVSNPFAFHIIALVTVFGHGEDRGARERAKTRH